MRRVNDWFDRQPLGLVALIGALVTGSLILVLELAANGSGLPSSLIAAACIGGGVGVGTAAGNARRRRRLDLNRARRPLS